MNMGVFPSGQWGQTVNLLLFSFGGSNPPAPTKNSSIRTGYWSFCFICRTKGTQGWIRTATATTAASGRNREELLGLRPAGCACRPRHDAAAGSRDPGSFSARLAQSTRAHQKTSAYASTLRFLFSPAFPSPAKNTCISGTPCYDTNQKKSYKVIRRY